MRIIIPCRMGSKGLPFKNRQLFKYTADIIPISKKRDTWVSTDDPEIIDQAIERGFNVLQRPTELSQDSTSIREVMLHAIRELKIRKDEFITMLYLTYPQRKWQDVEQALDFFLQYYQEGATSSLLCKKELLSHPYLCLEQVGPDGVFGKQLKTHDLYRRQDYPPCFELSHYISIFEAGSIFKLNNNLYAEDTIYYSIPNVVDVDLQKDLEEFTHG